MPSPKQYKRPKNPPRPSSLAHFSNDSASSFRTAPASPLSPGPDSPSIPTSNSTPTLSQQSSLRPSTPPPQVPTSPRSSPTGSSRSRTSFRKPVPTFDSSKEAPSPKTVSTSQLAGGKPRLTNPNPFAAANALIASVGEGASGNIGGGRPSSIDVTKSNSGQGGRAGPGSPDELSPTSEAPAKKSKSPLPSPSLFTEELGEGEEDFAPLNFNRRPSQFDPIAPSFHHHSGGPLVHSSNGSRSLLPMSNTSKAVPPLPSPTPSFERSGLHHRKSSSGHVRQPSISLSSPSSQNSPSLLPSHAQHPDSRKILPLQPAATGTASRTRAPLDTFASVEMLQGQREAMEKTRGTEVWGPGGYEGRASSVNENSGLPVRHFLLCSFTLSLTCNDCRRTLVVKIHFRTFTQREILLWLNNTLRLCQEEESVLPFLRWYMIWIRLVSLVN